MYLQFVQTSPTAKLVKVFQFMLRDSCFTFQLGLYKYKRKNCISVISGRYHTPLYRELWRDLFLISRIVFIFWRHFNSDIKNRIMFYV